MRPIVYGVAASLLLSPAATAGDRTVLLPNDMSDADLPAEIYGQAPGCRPVRPIPPDSAVPPIPLGGAYNRSSTVLAGLAARPLARAAAAQAGGAGRYRLEWPPVALPLPSPVATGDVTKALVKNRVGADLEETVAFLQRRLSRLGYQRKANYKFDRGVIIVTPYERVADDGGFAQPKHRWVMGKIPCSLFSFGKVVRNMFFGDSGRFRRLVFLISDQATPEDVVADAARRGDPFAIWPQTVKQPGNRRQYERPHLWMMVYEFRPSNSRKFTLVENRRTPLPFSAHAKWLGL